MIAAAGPDAVRALYADEPAQLPDEPARAGRVLVIKSHDGSEARDAWLADQGARLILSVRDPRDACLSMALRFRSPPAHAVQWLAADCRRMMRLASDTCLPLRYEERPFDDPVALARIADALRVRVGPSVMDDVFARYPTDACAPSPAPSRPGPNRGRIAASLPLTGQAPRR